LRQGDHAYAIFLLAAVVVMGGAAAARAQHAAAGAAVFKTQCAVCHAVAEGKNLCGFEGRQEAGEPDRLPVHAALILADAHPAMYLALKIPYSVGL
jgi:mono/diheme cytochrome c family protein